MLKENNSINNFKWRKGRIALSSSKKGIYIIKGNNIKTNFYCLNCLHSFRTKIKFKSHKKVCKKNKDFCGIVMPSEKDSRLEFNQYIKSDRMPYIIYADIESF